MGIKNIHIGLIACSCVVAAVFGFWALKNDYPVLGYVSLVMSLSLLVYGVDFVKKVKTL